MENFGKTFESPAQEISVLKERLQQLESSYKESAVEKARPEIAAEALREHLTTGGGAAAPSYKISTQDLHNCSLTVEEKKSEEEQVDALFAVAKKHGVLNAFEVARGLKNPHLFDLFHDAFIRRHDEFLGR